RTDHHVANRKSASLRDRPAPPRRPVEGIGRDRADLAGRRRNQGVPGGRSQRAALDSRDEDTEGACVMVAMITRRSALAIVAGGVPLSARRAAAEAKEGRAIYPVAVP